MKKIFLFAAFLLIIFSNNFAQAFDIKSHPRLAITDFANKAITSEGLKDQDFSSATEYALFQLSASNFFDLIDYEQMATIARIHSMNMSGLVDISTAPALGKFAAAQYVMVGAVTGLTSKESGLHAGGAGVKAGVSKHTVTANVTVRFVDVETLKIVAVGMGTGTSASSLAEISFNPYRNAENWIVQRNININIGSNNSISNENKISTATGGEYFIKVGSDEISAVQARNAISKAVRDAVYGKSGILTILNGGKQLKIKTGF